MSTRVASPKHNTPKHPFHPLSRHSLSPSSAPQPGDGASSFTRRPLPPPASSSCPATEDEGIAQTLKRSASGKSTRWTSFARRNPPRPERGAWRHATLALEHAPAAASPTAPAFPKRASITPPTAQRKVDIAKSHFSGTEKDVADAKVAGNRPGRGGRAPLCGLGPLRSPICCARVAQGGAAPQPCSERTRSFSFTGGGVDDAFRQRGAGLELLVRGAVLISALGN